jgi:hypothetical protein
MAFARRQVIMPHARYKKKVWILWETGGTVLLAWMTAGDDKHVLYYYIRVEVGHGWDVIVSRVGVRVQTRCFGPAGLRRNAGKLIGGEKLIVQDKIAHWLQKVSKSSKQQN